MLLPIKKSWASTIKERIFKNENAKPYGKYNITVSDKAVNLRDGDGMQVPCVPRLSGQKPIVEILKQQTSIKL